MLVKPKARTLKYYYLPDIIKFVEEKHKISNAHELISWLCCELEPREDCTYEKLNREWLNTSYWGTWREEPNAKIIEILQALFKEFAPKEKHISIWMDWQ